MKKTLAAATAALTFGGAVAAAALPTAAQARDWRGGGYRYYGGYGGYHHHNDAAGAALVAGIAGLAIGAALADSGHRSYYRSGYYGYGYVPGYDGYGPGYYDYGYYRPYGVCSSERWVWDPYIHERVLIRHRYAC
jgi:hypothetical protein